MQKIVLAVCGFLLLSIVLFGVLGEGDRDTSSNRQLTPLNSQSNNPRNNKRGITWVNRSKKSFKDESYGSKKFDLYEPQTEEEHSPPLVIVLHSGAFVTGNKRDTEIVELCETIASNGYKVASIDYQLITQSGFMAYVTNIFRLKTFCKEQILEANRDLSLSVRYFRDNANFYKIDPDNIFIAGYSAGAIVSLNTVFLDSDDFASYFDLDQVECLHCLGSTTSDFKVKGVISIGGAMFDKLSIDNTDKEVKALFLHGEKDDVVNLAKGRPFDKYFDADFELEIPGLYHELSLNRKDSNGEYEAWIFKVSNMFSVPKLYLETLQNSVMPTLYGPKVLKERMRRNGLSVEYVPIKGAKHNLFYNIDGTTSNHSKILTKKIIQFLNANS